MLADHLHEHRCPPPTSNEIRYACAKAVDLEQFLDFLFSGVEDFHSHRLLVMRSPDGDLYERSVVPAVIEASREERSLRG